VDPLTEGALRNLSDAQVELLRRRFRYYEDDQGNWIPGAAFFNFCKVGLGLTAMDWEAHGELCSLFEHAYYGRVPPQYVVGGIYTQMHLLPRGGFKTTVITVGGTIWALLQNDPPDPTKPQGGWEPPRSFNGKKGYDQRFLLIGETDEKGKEFGGLIQSHFQRNGIIHKLFGRFQPEKYSMARWSSKSMDLSSRQDRVAREANVNITSIDAAKVGGHYDVAILDDIVTDRQITSEEMIAKGIRLYEGLQPIMDPPLSLIFINGTRWHDADLYGKLEKSSHVRVLLERAERTDDEIAAGKSPLWFPSRLSQEVLDGKKTTMPLPLFHSQYNNDVVSEATAIFKKDFFTTDLMFDLEAQYPNESDLWEWLGGLVRITTVDPAISKGKGACHAVVLTCGWDPFGHCWLLDMMREKGVEPRALLEEVFRQNRVWAPDAVGMEKRGFQRVYHFNAEEMALDLKEYPPWVELNEDLRSKDLRIKGLEPLCRSRRFHWQAKHQAIIDEFIRFPAGTYRDALDAMAYQPELASRGEGWADRLPTGPEERERVAYEKKVALLEATAYKGTQEDWYYR